MKLSKIFLNNFLIDTRLGWKDQWEVEISSLIVLICWATNGTIQIDTNPIKDGDKCFQYAAIVALDLGK